MGVTSGSEMAKPSSPAFSVFFSFSILVICVVFCRSLFVLFSFFGHCIACSSINDF